MHLTVNGGEAPLELEHVVVPDPAVGTFDGDEVVEFGMADKFILNLRRRESFVRDDDASGELLIPHEGRERRGVDTIAREYLRAHGLHLLHVVRVDDRNVLAALDVRLVGVGREVVHRAGVLLEHAVDEYVMIGFNAGDAVGEEGFALASVHAEPFQKLADVIA